MKLFLALFRRKNMPNGHIYRGKQRLVKPVTWKDEQALRNSFAIEEKNMFYLRHPFLTSEQSSGHARDLGKREQRSQWLKQLSKEFKENVTIESRLGHLRYQESWD